MDSRRSGGRGFWTADKQEWLQSQGYAVTRFTWPEVQFQQPWAAGRERRRLAA